MRTGKVDGATIAIDVPVRPCEKCGEQWFSIQTMRMIEAAQRGELKPVGSIKVTVFVADTA